MELSIDIDGLDELVAKLTQAASDGVFTQAHREVADVVDERSQGLANTRQLSRSVRSNKVRVGRKGPEIKIGGGGGDGRWAVGAQYGAHVYKQFPGYREDGYTVLPAIDQSADDITRIYGEAVTKTFDN